MKLSISSLKLFKACRCAWKFRYIENLVPVQQAEALETGKGYHELLEFLYNNGTLDGVEEDNSKELAMACAYWKHVYPRFKMKNAEEWFEYPLSNGHTLIGRVDGIAEDGNLVEHKTTSSDIAEEYEYNLQWDEQILAYMLATGTRKVWYTVIKKPTIRQKKNETDEEFFRRMVEWYDEDTDSKIRVLELERTDEEVEAFEKQLLTMTEMISEAESSNKEGEFYRNPLYCNCWGRRCEYSSICLNYNPNEEYIEFERRER